MWPAPPSTAGWRWCRRLAIGASARAASGSPRGPRLGSSCARSTAMTASAIGSMIARGRRELPVSRGGRQRPQRRGHQLRAAEDHRGHQTGGLVEPVVATGCAGQQRDSGRHRQFRRHQIRSGQRAVVGEVQRGPVGVADVAVGGGRVPDEQQPARLPGELVAPARRGRRRCGGTARPSVTTSGSTARRAISAAKCRASGVSGDGLPEHRAQRRVRPLARHARVEDQQRRDRRGARPNPPACARECTMFGGAAIRTSASSIRR